MKVIDRAYVLRDIEENKKGVLTNVGFDEIEYYFMDTGVYGTEDKPVKIVMTYYFNCNGIMTDFIGILDNTGKVVIHGREQEGA